MFSGDRSVDGLGLAERRKVSRIFNDFYVDFNEYERRKEGYLERHWFLLEETERKFDLACEELKNKNRTVTKIEEYFKLKENEARPKKCGRRVLLFRNGGLVLTHKIPGERAVEKIRFNQAHLQDPEALKAAEATLFPGYNFDLPVSILIVLIRESSELVCLPYLFCIFLRLYNRLYKVDLF